MRAGGAHAATVPVFPLALALALPLSLLPLLPGCTCSGGGEPPLPPEAGRDFGNFTAPPPDAAHAAAYLALARAVLEHRPPPAPSPPATGDGDGHVARRIVLAYYPAPLTGEAAVVVATAMGPTLADAVGTAAGDIARKVSPAPAASAAAALAGLPALAALPGRLELDVPTGLAGTTVEEDQQLPLASIGLEGILLAGDDGRVGVVLPGEIVQRHLFHDSHEHKPPGLAHERIAPLVAIRAGVAQTALPSMRAYRFRADAYVEAAARSAPSASVLHVLRGMAYGDDAVTLERLLAAVRHGADYLVRITNPQGRFEYMYHPIEDRSDASYGWLRHAGTCYALLEAYDELRTQAYLDDAELALRYLDAHLRTDPESGGKYALDTNDEEEQKVGGAGISLVAFAKHAAVTGKRDDLETMRALARLIMKEQYDDGHFRSNADVERETGRKLKREVIYYTGEAVLGLVRLYAIDPQPAYLDAARRGADWVVHVRDQYVSDEHQEHDHWMAYALNELYRITKDRAYLEHAYKIARAIHGKQQKAADSPAADLVGTFFNGITTPASTRLEAYDSAIEAARFAGEPDAWILGPATDVARSTLGQQYDDDNAYWLKNPAKAAGGVRESLFNADVEIDYVQHAMSGWLHLARILRDPAYGKNAL